MTTTLKEHYASRQLSLLAEAIDPKQLQQMLQIIGNIENVISPVRNKLPTLSAAVDEAKNLAAQKLSGEGGFWKKVGQNIGDKLGLVDDIKKFITFQASMLQGMKSLPRILSLLKKSGIDTTAADVELEKSFANNADNRMQIVKAIANAFSPPQGIFTKQKTPFVKDLGTAASEFFKLTPKELDELANRAGSLGKMPVSSEDAKTIMQSSNEKAAQMIAGGETKQGSGKDAAGQPAGSTKADQTVSSSTNATGQQKSVKFPDFETSLKAIGAQNLDDPKNKKTIDAFRRFYDYLSKNSK